MPRIPTYDSKVGMTGGGVNPASVWSRDINVRTGWPQVFAGIQQATNQASSLLASTLAQEQQRSKLMQMSTSTTEFVNGLTEIDKKYAGSVDPKTPELIDQDLQALVQGITQKASPELQPLIAVHLAQTAAVNKRSMIKTHLTTVRQQDMKQLGLSADTIASAAARAYVNQDSAAYNNYLGNLHGLEQQATQLGMNPWNPGEVDRIVKGKILGILLAENPRVAEELLKTPAGRKELGVDDENYPQVQNKVKLQMDKIRADKYDSILKGIAQANPVLPSAQDLSVLSGGQQLHVKNILKSLNETTDDAALVPFNRAVNDLPLDETTAQKGAALLDTIAAAPGISAANKVALHNRLYQKMAKSRTIVSEFEEQTLKDLTAHFPAAIKDQFYLAWQFGDEGRRTLPPDAKMTDILKKIQGFMPVWIGKARDAAAAKTEGVDLGATLKALESTKAGKKPATVTPGTPKATGKMNYTTY